jgi:SAM-dependent methyltransferase
MEVQYSRPYSCIYCGSPLLAFELSHLRCIRCLRIYPMVSGIPVLTHRPRALLSAYTQALRRSASRIRELESAETDNPDSNSSQNPYRGRVQGALAGMRSNLSLLQTYMKPAEAHLEGESMTLGFADAISSWGAGWSADGMLPYFYIDWGNTDAFSRVQSFLLASLREHSADSEAIAVLGAGACGLVNALAKHFDYAYGIDLSLSVLLVANGVLRGDPIVVHFKDVGWRAAELRNRQPPHTNIRLAVADVVSLPFEGSSLSAVVTQYLMDIVGNPLRVANEIHRVLKPGGVWLNYSLPLHQPAEPPEFGLFTLDELPAFLKSADLQLVKAHHDNFVVTDFRRFDQSAPVWTHNVHFFIAQRPAAPSASGTVLDHNSTLGESDDTWWDTVPRFFNGNTAQIIHATSYRAGLRNHSPELSFGLDVFPLNRFPIAEDHANFLMLVLDLIDGKRTFGQIRDQLTPNGFQMTDSDLRELFYYLSDRHGIVRIDTPQRRMEDSQ